MGRWKKHRQICHRRERTDHSVASLSPRFYYQASSGRFTERQLVALLIGLVALIGFVYLFGVPDEPDLKPLAPATPASDLHAVVQFNGADFFVTNSDNYAWAGVEMEINFGILDNGYTLKVPSVGPGETVALAATEFSKADRTRFNPLHVKARQFAIHNSGNSSSYYCEWP